MKSVEPVYVVDLFEPMLDRLLELLRQLSEEEWYLATPCEGWTVKDVALHLLGDDVGWLSRERDKDTSYTLPPGADFVSRINAQNALWVEATRRMSPRLLCDLLTITGREVAQHFKTLQLMDMNGSVSWAGPDPAPVWLDVAREYTERWHHQQHIREAVQRPGLAEAAFLTPVLDTFVRALPYTFRSIEAPDNTVVELKVVGDVDKSWFLLRQEAQWSLFADTSLAVVGSVVLEPETAWRLFTKGVSKEEAMGRASVWGDRALALNVFDAVAIIA
jgi:uncharacterized protein (TIGR03083 family)